MSESRSPTTGRLKLKLTAEGIAYLVILVFIAVGAVLRSVNLLILLGGMMCAPLLLSWRSKMHVMKHLQFFRHVPQYIHAGTLAPVQWECENNSQRLNAWNIVIQDSARNVSGQDPDAKRNRKLGAKAKVVFPAVELNRSGFATYRTFFATRGTYEFGPAKVETDFPFGLLRAKRLLTEIETVVVAPELGRLSHSWDQRLESIALGSEASRRRRGVEEDEFYALRKWRSGDSRRLIHWRSTAKYGVPMIRQHDQKTNRDLALVLDLRAVDETQKDACETALSFAATVFANLGTAVQGQVVLAVCGNDNLIVTDRFHPETVVRVMRCLGTIQTAPWNSSHPEDPLPEAVIKAAGCVSAGTPVFVISPGSERARTENWGAADNPRLSGVMSIMHWLQVGSTEFEQMFATSDPEQQQRVDALREKWTANVTR